MPTNRKKQTRARMQKTGESYQAALQQIRAPEEEDTKFAGSPPGLIESEGKPGQLLPTEIEPGMIERPEGCAVVQLSNYSRIEAPHQPLPVEEFEEWQHMGPVSWIISTKPRRISLEHFEDHLFTEAFINKAYSSLISIGCTEARVIRPAAGVVNIIGIGNAEKILNKLQKQRISTVAATLAAKLEVVRKIDHKKARDERYERILSRIRKAVEVFRTYVGPHGFVVDVQIDAPDSLERRQITVKLFHQSEALPEALSNLEFHIEPRDVNVSNGSSVIMCDVLDEDLRIPELLEGMLQNVERQIPDPVALSAGLV